MNPAPPRCTTLVCSALLSASAALGQQGFEYDYPDGLGVRHLLYDRIERAPSKAKDDLPELRAKFLPKSKADWVRINGTAIWWGMHLYEFRGDEGGFADFLRERDPRRTFRAFRVDGEQVKGRDLRYWEFTDTWRPLVEVLDRPQPRGGFRYAVSPELGVRFLADKSMSYSDPYAEPDGDNCFARVLPAPHEWVRIEGIPGPVGWMLRVHVFPDLPRNGSSSDRKRLVDSFAKFATEADPRLRKYDRTFEVRDVEAAGALPYRSWRWTDYWKRTQSGATPCFHHVAAVYRIDGREVALVGFAPANDKASRHESMRSLETMVTSLERWSGTAKDPGFAYYSVAGSCRVGDREVALVVYIPYGDESKPDKTLLDAAKRMVKSLEPGTGKK